MNWHSGYRMGLCPNDLTRFLRSLASRPIVASAAVFLLVLAGCATTDEQRFPLNYVSGQRSAADPATAREALQAYQRMGADLERQGRSAQAAIAYSNAYSSARALGRLQDALVVGQKAVEMAERSRSPRRLAPALFQLGHTHMALNSPAKAIPLFEDAARHAKEAGAANSEASSYTWLARAYRQIGNPDLAMQSTEKAASVLESAITQMWAGRRLSPQGEAILRRMERNYAKTLLAIAGNHLALRQMEPAQAAFQKALDAAKRTGSPYLIAQAQHGLGGVAMFQGDWEPAARFLEEALRLSQQPSFVQEVQRRLGLVYRQMGKLPEAEALLPQAVASIEDVRSQFQSEKHREAFVEDKMGAYGNLIGVLFDQRKFAEAFDMSERARARAFLDLLGNRVSLSRGRSAALIAEEKALQERIVQLKARQELEEGDEEAPQDAPHSGQRALQRELELARNAYGAFLSRVRAQSREQASLMTVEPLSLPEVQKLLEPETALVEYFVGGGRTLVWVVSRNRLRPFRLWIEEAELTKRVSEFRDLIASRGRLEELRDAAHNLYKMLLAPAFPAGLPRELIVVPQRVLHYLPFHALMPAPGRYLVQDSLVSYLSSASLLQFTREKQTAALAVGNPDLEDPSLNLRYAEREVREVKRIIPEAIVLVRKEATKTQTRRHLDARSLVHLATHADLEEEDPLGSALLLRPEGSDDGRLEVQEVFGLDLKANLVILSACDTSLGRLTQGDEVIGLTRAFIYAGTPSVISTLWRVNDRASYELMLEFYRN